MIAVFGGNGQVGTELVRRAAETNVSLTAVGRPVDVAERGAVEQALTDIRPSLVINAAAYTKVDLAEQEVEAAERANVLGPSILAAACAERGVPLVHLSTDYVFSGQKPGPYVETDQVAPMGVYGRTKAAGEEAVRQGLARHIIVRTAWVYGEFGANFLKTMIRLARECEELRVVSDQRGSPTSTRDLARALLHIAARLGAGEPAWGTYHFAGQGVTTWHGLAERIIAAQAQVTGRSPKVTAITTADYPTAARRPANSTLDCTRFIGSFGFHARHWTSEVDEISVAVAKAHETGQVHHVA